MDSKLAMFLFPLLAWAQTTAGPKTFSTPQEAAQALVAANTSQDVAALRTILGPGGQELIESGDPTQDAARRERFANNAKESMHVEEDPFEPGRWIISVGPNNWPLPIPIVNVKGGYQFNVDAAKEEILARRVGANELDAIALLRALAAAEIDYAYSDVNGSGMRAYSRRIISDPGKHNGLYWSSQEGEKESPLTTAFGDDPFSDQQTSPAGQPLVYRGYVFRPLTSQGPNASGGARDYLVGPYMIGGFAFIAYPAQYGVSGVKTFEVNQDGVVVEKDLGPNTNTTAAAVRRYNPDKTWSESPREQQ